MKRLVFKNGDEMPAIGLGTWKSDEGKVGRAVKIAVTHNYRHIDCAPTYGNEEEIGEALSELLSENKVKREELWITSKLWNNAHKKEDVLPALKKTLKDLQLDYLDLYLIHWPVAFKPDVDWPESADDYLSLEEAPLSETWEMMQEAKRQGLVKHIGVSNFSIEKLKELINAEGENPEMNQVELHPYLQQEELLDFCKEREIHVTAYSPLGSTDRPERLKEDTEPSLLDNEVIKKIADKNEATPAQVLLKWSMLRGNAVVVKSTNKERIIENLKSTEIDLSQEDRDRIRKLDRHYRYLDGSFFVTENNSYENVFDD